MIIDERNIRETAVIEAGQQIMVAARTAPKGKGVDILEVVLVTQPEIEAIADEMRIISEETGFKFFLRDADNIMQAEAMILIGTREFCQGLNCNRCGYSKCENRPDNVPCAINTIDVGIAVGSACAKAADLRIDSRVLHSAGMAAMRLGIPHKEIKCTLAIPLSCKSKNPFFDRKPKTT